MTNAGSPSERNQMLVQTVSMGYEFSKAEDAAWAVSRTKELIAEGADVNYAESRSKDWTVLCNAISGGNPEIIRLLLDNGAKVTTAALGNACNGAGRAVNESGFFKIDEEFSKTRIARREQIALMIIGKAAKDDFIGTNWQKKTLLDFAAPSTPVTAALKEALKDNGLTEADLSSSKKKAIKFLKQKISRFNL